MPKPQDVRPNNFTLKKVLFDNGGFSVACGVWEGNPNTLVMRWNGDDGDDKGYPKTFGNPMWFVVHDDLKSAIIKGIAEVDPSFLLE